MNSKDDAPVIAQCLCAWSDLLGFGSALRQGGWNDIVAILPILERVVRLQQQTLETACDTETIFMVNDGVARNYDYMPEKGLYRLLSWLRDLWISHSSINQIEQKEHGHPGIRTVLAAGSRVTYNSSGDMKKEAMILARRPNWTVDDARVLFMPQFLNNTAFYVPIEFQMNLAFAKAYALETAGSKAGLSGPRFFIDQTVVDFLLSDVNGTCFQFLTDDRCPKPVIIQSHADSESRSINFLAPNYEGRYHKTGIILLDPVPISNDHSTLWATRFIMHPYADSL